MKVLCRRSKFATVATVCLLNLLSCYLSLSVADVSAENTAGRLVFSKGSVHLKKPGNEIVRGIRPGYDIFAGDILETGEEGRAQVRLTDESVITLSTGSAVSINQYSFDSVTNRRTSVVRILKGKVRIVLYRERSRDSWFKVVTANSLTQPTADIVVNVSEGKTSLVVLHGWGTVSNSSNLIVGTVNLGQNQRTEVIGNNPPAAPTIITEEFRRAYSKDADRF